MDIKYLIIASITLALNACSIQDEPHGDKLDTPVAAEFSAAIGEPVSRAYNTSWEAGDAIGISGAGYSNKKYTTYSGSLGDFNYSDGAASGIFFQTTSNVTFTAYYPFSGTDGKAPGTNGVISLSTATQTKSNQNQFDFLFATATANYKAPAIGFNFLHKMTKLSIKVENDYNSGVSKDEILNENNTYSLSGIKHSGTFNTATGDAKATGTATDNWAMTVGGTEKPQNNRNLGRIILGSYIFFPQPGTTLTVSMNIAGQNYSCEISPELAAGTTYTYTITVKKTGLEVSNCAITNWEPGTSGTGTATPVDPFNGHPAVLMREASGTPGSDDYAPALYFADRNLGASTPAETGLYFWWGDVTGHAKGSDFDFDSYYTATAGKTIQQLYSGGYITTNDATTAVLESKYDAASKIFGGEWRMPTSAEWQWLKENCTWTWKAAGAYATGYPAGYEVKSNSSGGSILLPVSGEYNGTSLTYETSAGYYWSASPVDDTFNAYCVFFYSSDVKQDYRINRYCGIPIRAVLSN